MFCPNCGKAMPDTAKFCPDCGMAVKAAAPAAPEMPAAAEVPAAPEMPVMAEVPAAPEMPAAAEVPAVPEMPAEAEVPAAPEVPAAAEAPAVPEMPAAAEAPAVPEMPAAAEAPAAPEMPAAPAQPARPPVHSAPAQPVQPPVHTRPQQHAAPVYAAQPNVQPPAQPRPKVKKPIVPMLITFISAGLAVIVFLAALFAFGGQKKGDASLRPRDLLGVWDLCIEIQAANEDGETAEVLLEADMWISEDPAELYGDEYMLVEMLPTRVTENGEEEELDGDSLAPFYALLQDGKLYFEYLPDIQIAVPMQRSGGSVVMPVEEDGFTGTLTCRIQK